MKLFKNVLVLVCVLSGAHAFGFGYSGSDGSSGTDGYDGRNGEDIITIVDGSEQSFSLNGTNGTSGSNGSSGSSASSCYQDTGHSNEYGASGGDGGRGGDGGAGGRGGDLTFFYKDIKDLKNIFIENQGGYGAPGGYGSAGGYGCSCSTYSWSHEVCSTSESCTTTESCSTERVCEETGATRTENGQTAPIRRCHDRRTCTPSTSCRPVTTCSNESYSCSDGSDGSSGRDGYHGQDGRYGHIKLVKNITELPGELLSLKTTFKEASSVDLEMAKQIWVSKSGIKSLLSENSNVSDSYSEYSHLATRKFRFVWAAKRSMDEFNSLAIELSYDGEKINFSLPKELFIEKEVEQVDGITIVTVTKLFKKDELEKLKISETKSYGKKLQLLVKDEAGVSSDVETKVRLQFVHKKLLSWYVVYDKEVPAKNLDITDDKIIVNVGELGIPSEYIKKNKRVRYTLWIGRKFGDNSTTVNLHQGKIKLR